MANEWVNSLAGKLTIDQQVTALLRMEGAMRTAIQNGDLGAVERLEREYATQGVQAAPAVANGADPVADAAMNRILAQVNGTAKRGDLWGPQSDLRRKEPANAHATQAAATGQSVEDAAADRVAAIARGQRPR
jgi:hypothetical protein